MCSSSTASRRRPAIAAGLALLLMLASLPWPGTALAAPPGRSGPGQLAVPPARLSANAPAGNSAEPALAPAESAPLARPSAIAVIYPDLGEPYRAIFNAILRGIEAEARLPVQRYPITSGTEPAGLQAQLRRNGTGALITLGRQGVQMAAALETDLPIVAGGVLAAPEASRVPLTGISLAPDPGLLFTHLKRLLPDIRRVSVVYNPQQNAWLLRQAALAADAQGLELQALPARDLATAVRLYKNIFAAAQPGRDALWLPQDLTTVDEDVVLPLVLRESWGRDVAVLSSSLLHVRKGALFGLYPDNAALGRALAGLAQDSLNGLTPTPGLIPLQTVLTAINLRTASHLGVKLTPPQQRRFDFVFPEP